MSASERPQRFSSEVHAVARSGSIELSPKLRSDLEWSRRGPAHAGRWIVRDPIACTYYYFNDIEQKLLEMFDGRHSLSEIVAWARRQFPSMQWTSSWWNQFLSRLERASLLVVTDRPLSTLRWKRFRDAPSSWSWGYLGQLLAWRQRLCDPTHWIVCLSPISRWLFSPIWIAMALMLSGFVWFCVLLRLWENPLTWNQVLGLLQGERLVGLFFAFLVTKALHELGHLLACQKQGIPCREIGIVWLFMTPLLYCDTSESWRLPRWYHRAGIAAAGMYVEWLVATIAAVAWLVLLPSGWQALAANFMVVCSIGTLMVNVNPLLRYDGYYILSDFWGVPNLADQSREVIREGIHSWMAGTPVGRARWDASPWWLAIYGIASLLYRSLMLLAILWAIWIALEPMGLGLVAVGISALLLIGTSVGWCRNVYQTFVRLASSPRVRWLRLSGAFALIIAAVWFIVDYPLPNAIIARAVVHYPQSQPLFANAEAECVAYHPHGDLVMEKMAIAELKSTDKELQRAQVSSQCDVLKERLALLDVLSVDDATAVAEHAIVREQLTEQQSQLAILDRDLQQLRLTAAHQGIFVAASGRPDFTLVDRDARQNELTQSTAWLSPERKGASVPMGVLLGWVVNPTQIEVHAFVSDLEIDQLQPEQRVRCRFDGLPWESIDGKVGSVLPEPIATTPDVLIDDARFVSLRSEDGRWVPERPHYQIPVALPVQPHWIRPGAVATVRIEVPPLTLWERLCRFARHHLRW